MQILTYDFNDIVLFYQQKNGKYIFDFSHRQGNIYKTLRQLGYCRTKMDNKVIFYKRDADQIIPTNIIDIRNAFRDYLKECNPTTLPKGLTPDDILNAYYEKLPVKQNGLFEHYLEDSLTPNEEYNLKLLTSPSFRQDNRAEKLLSKFQEWQMTKSIDNVGAYAKGKDIFYKRIDYKKYLVFNHVINDPVKHRHIFDCWLATYQREKDITNKKPYNVERIMFGFRLERDIALVQKYIASK